jgi:Protein of unknown function (DUF1579)
MSDSKNTETLQNLLGAWEGTTKTWLEPGKQAIEEKNTGTFEKGVNDNFVVHTYESSMQGKPFKGLAIYGYDQEKETFQCAWIDGFHMSGSIMFSEGKATEKGFSVLGSFSYGDAKYGWRTEVTIVDADEIKITAYFISPEGEEEKGVETIYKRSSK